MFEKLLCKLGFHDWVTIYDPDTSTNRRFNKTKFCRRCNKQKSKNK